LSERDKRDMQGKKIEPSISSKCLECVWKDNCIEEAEAKQTYRCTFLTRKQKELLNGMEIINLEQLSHIDIREAAKRQRYQNLCLTCSGYRRSPRRAKVIMLKKHKLPASETEIFFDIEGETELGVDYLYGIMVRKGGEENIMDSCSKA